MSLGTSARLLLPSCAALVLVTSGRYEGAHDSERVVLERVLPWALGRGDSTYRLPEPRAVRLVADGEWPEARLTAAERARYAGSYRHDDVVVRVWEEGGLLRINDFPGLEGGVVHLVPLGDHVFAFGRYEAGRLARIYWPDGRIEFRMGADYATGYLDRSEDGHVYATAERVR